MNGEVRTIKLFRKGERVGGKLLRPFEVFASVEASGGILMVVMTAAALIWINSSLRPHYEAFLHFPIVLGVGDLSFERSVHFWINDILMTIFFFVVGLEVKREILVGELASIRQAALPAAGALGGVIVPALIYYILNRGTSAQHGWGVPMATDIAFVLGALAVLKSRLPASLAVFLVSLAIFDDLCAVVVIALFYSTDLQLYLLVYAALVVASLAFLNVLGFRRPLPYALLGVVLWVLIYHSGIHATVAGVLLALTIPCRSAFDTCEFADSASEVINEFDSQEFCGYTLHLHERNQSVIRTLEEMCHRMEPPLQRMEHFLHPWVTYAIMPLFALANAGVDLHWDFLKETLMSPASLGIMLGLFVGKQIGIFAAVWLAVKSGLAVMPNGVGFKHIYGGAILCGIGFTMSLFISELSFQDQEMIAGAKIAILVASILSAVIGMIVLHLTGERDAKQGLASPASI